jgi:hypothetical protein
MNSEAAILHARATAALVEAIGMLSENLHRLNNGAGAAYGSEEFDTLLQGYGLTREILSAGDLSSMLAATVSVAERASPPPPAEAEAELYLVKAQGYVRSKVLKRPLEGIVETVREELLRQEGLPLVVVDPTLTTHRIESEDDLEVFLRSQGKE